MEENSFDRMNHAAAISGPTRPQSSLQAVSPLHVQLTVFGIPVAKGRPRVRLVKSGGSGKGFAQTYTPAKTRKYEDLLREEAGRVMNGREPLQGPLTLDIRVYVQTPQALAKHKTKGPQAEAGDIRPLTKPDWDNYAKVTDALNGIVWRDDSQIVDGRVRKFYSTRPRLVLVVFEQ